MEALFGHAYVEDLTRYSDGRNSSRMVERPRVRVDEWMNDLQPGDAWLRVAPIDTGWRQERVRVALPRTVPARPLFIPAVSRQPKSSAHNPDNEPVSPTHPTNSWAPSGAANGAGRGVDNGLVKREAGSAERGNAVAGLLTREQVLLRDPEAVRYVWARIKAHGLHRLYWTGPRDRKGYGRVR